NVSKALLQSYGISVCRSMTAKLPTQRSQKHDCKATQTTFAKHNCKATETFAGEYYGIYGRL
ncbi:hypothetical protein, partial [Gardnerella vaginalis]|uniref:hypothetical protein n=1 Tax=Gardnerella vaginalis TaxID=2702 RepID=UPI000353F356